MVNGADQLNQLHRSRTSLVFLAISLAGIYYSSQVVLKYQSFWWVEWIAVASGVLFFAGLSMAVDDWTTERGYRNDLRNRVQAETATLRSEEPKEEEEDEEPAESVSENEMPDKFSFEKMNT